jgi:cold shock CspA family protein
MMGRIKSWAGTHGLISPDGGGQEIYVSGADMPRNVNPRVGMRVSFEIEPERLPDASLFARACLVVIDGDDANG